MKLLTQAFLCFNHHLPLVISMTVLARIVNGVNYWARYRDPNPNNSVNRTPQQVQAYYRIQNYVEPLPGALPGAAAQYRDLGFGQPLIRPPARDVNPAHRQFLD